jgi:hypothetical protein
LMLLLHTLYISICQKNEYHPLYED